MEKDDESKDDEDKKQKTTKNAYVYLLESSDHATYVGATVDPNRRLRQHNKEIKGGAHLTGSRVAKGETWSRICYIQNFPDWSAALQFEWRFKQISRKLPMKMMPFERRLKALNMLLAFDRPTTKAIAYSEWENPPEIIWDNIDAKEFYEKMI